MLKIVGELLWNTLCISFAWACKFLWLIETRLSFSNSSLNEEVLSPNVILKAQLCKAFISLPSFFPVEHL